MVTAENIRIGRGTLTTCWDSYTRNGRVTTEKLWLYLPDDGERRFLGLVSEMTREEAARASKAPCGPDLLCIEGSHEAQCPRCAAKESR